MPSKVILWYTPRSVSTAFERAIQQADNVKVFHEPYVRALLLGPDKKGSNKYADKIDAKIVSDLYLSYQDVKSLITADYNGRDTFVKANPFAVADCFEDFLTEEMLCITHSFIIRSPEKAFKSCYKVWIEDPHPDLPEFDAMWMVIRYEKQFQLYHFIVQKLNQQPVIIDGDDLLNNPEKILREYCSKTGLTYEENMLNWKGSAGDQIERVPWKAFHEVALKSKGFQVPKEKDYSFIPEKIVKNIEECIAKCQESYNTLYEKRLKT